jgi:hypothetical protein
MAANSEQQRVIEPLASQFTFSILRLFTSFTRLLIQGNLDVSARDGDGAVPRARARAPHIFDCLLLKVENFNSY